VPTPDSAMRHPPCRSRVPTRHLAARLALAALAAGAAAAQPAAAQAPEPRARARALGVAPGIFRPGAHNAITDVAGVRVGHATVVAGDSVRTGVTAVLPHGGNLFFDRVPAAVHVGNAFGKFVGATQVQELGELETPVLLTCTLCVWRAADALAAELLAAPGMGEVRSINPVVGETNDGQLNAIRARPLPPDAVRRALAGARGGPVAEGMIRALEAQSDTGIRIVGVFDDRGDDRSSDVIAGYPKLGTVDDLVDYARKTQLDLVIFTVPLSAETRLLQMLSKLWVLPIDIRLGASTSKLRLRPRSYSYLGSVPVLDLFDKPMADWDLVVKWLFDRIVGALLVAALSPVMLAVAIAIKLDSRGPVFFRQKRYGFNNELIEVFKFRSMYVDQCDVTAAKLVTKDDPRVTRVGRFIRKTSLDELPQLLNVVLKGDLSLVGPRPHALHAKAANQLYDQVVDGYFARHKVKPGITGWAQINGWRGETDTQEKIQRRVEHDLYYIEHWSVFFDLQILAATPLALFKTENAY